MLVHKWLIKQTFVFGLIVLAAHSARATTYFGLYRGSVVANSDPLLLGRLKVVVPSVTGRQASVWALPVLQSPYTVSSLKLPPVGRLVWILYEAGNPSSPVWLGVIPH